MVHFAQQLALQPGENSIVVTAIDTGGLSYSVPLKVERRLRFHETRYFIPAAVAGAFSVIGLGFAGQMLRRNRARRRRFNPYIAGAPVLDDDMFYGREKRDEFNVWLHLVVPILTTAALIWVFWKNVETLHPFNPKNAFDYSPLIGRSNPLAPPIDVEADAEGNVTARVVFGSAYEGPPGCVHGGYVAAAFDEVLGYAETFSGAPGMTGTLNVVYRTPTPLHTEVVFHAKITRVEGRKIFVHGTLHAGERLCAESDAIFVSIRAGRYLELMKERASKRSAQ
jgi:acyl-coenzyme A thioesterase PaaI-like protein